MLIIIVLDLTFVFIFITVLDFRHNVKAREIAFFSILAELFYSSCLRGSLPPSLSECRGSR